MEKNKQGFKLGSWWKWEQWRDGKLIDTWENGNIVTNEGLDAILDIMFHGSAQITPWYIALFEDNHTPAAGDTYAVPGYTESTAYSEANRVVYNEAAASSQSITNSANKASFSINATKTIYGAALVGGGTNPSVKSDTASGGTLFNSSQFSGGAKSVENGDTLKVTITINAADA